MGRFKDVVFHASKAAGLFRVSKLLTRNRLRILCYHGTALQEEADFRPQLFIRPHQFEARLRYLHERRFPVLQLDEALRRLEDGALPKNATVITIDDGFHSTYLHAFRELKKRGFPATVYVTTYYAQKGNPVFRLAAQYLFWATKRPTLSLDTLGLGISGEARLDSPDEKERTTWRIIEHAEQQLDEPARKQLIDRLAAQLDVAFGEVEQQRLLALMTADELSELAREGIDLQLHTHRHRFPEEPELVRREIEENRALLEPIAGRTLEHFCYPSGVYSPKQFPILEQLGVKSATTCELGLNTRKTPRLALKRFLDGSNISDIEFEAEMNGFSELLREARGAVNTLRRKLRPQQALAAVSA